MKQLNDELGLKHQIAKDLDEDESFKVRMERKDSNKSDQNSPSCDDLEDSLAPLHHHSSPDELDDPFPSLDRNRQLKRPSTSDEEDAAYDERLRQSHSSSSVNRASTFNYGSKSRADAVVTVNIDSDTSERGGSLRITRHSKRARGKMDHIFNKPDLSLLLKGEESPTSPPSFNITPCSPPLHHHSILSPTLDESTDSATPTAETALILKELSPQASSPRTSPAASRRRRRAGMVPPAITTTPEQSSGDQLQACPFHNSLASRASPRPCRRNTSSPALSSAGEDGASPKPRKKKVSVAQIEATFAPPTPVNLDPPQHLSRSPSMNTVRTHQDAFADNAFRSVMQISQDAICCANSVGDIVFWSVGACKMFGYTPGEAIGSSLEVCHLTGYKNYGLHLSCCQS